MAKVSYNFRAYAVDESDHWSPPPALDGLPVFGVYFLLEGEATHICSFQASSRAEFLQNVFLFDPENEAAHDAADGLMFENGGEWTSYFGYVDCSVKGNRPYLSQRVRITIDSRDYEIDPAEYAAQLARALRFESPRKAHATARYNCLRERAYEEALEYFQGNWPRIPVLESATLYEQHRRRKLENSARYSERYRDDLFSASGIKLPIALPPFPRNVPAPWEARAS